MPDKTIESSLPESIAYGTLSERNPDHDGGYVRRLRALYEGGKSVLKNKALMDEIFPRHRREVDEVYNQRRSRAFYVGTAGGIINLLTSTLMSDPVIVALHGDKALPEWYTNFQKDVTPKGGPTVTLLEFLRSVAESLLITRDSWVRVDLPKAGEYTDREAQEKAGALDAYLIHIPTECVIDWEDNPDGSLKMAVIHTCDFPRKGLASKRDTVIERWAYYDANMWAHYELAHKVDDKIEPDHQVSKASEGAHTFGVTPIVRKSVPNGLWAMNALESLAREHFNKRSALSWGEFQSLLPELYEFLGPEQSAVGTLIGDAQKSADRATEQPRGQGYVQKRGKDDKAQFIGPPTEPFEVAAKSCTEIRDEMHRVMHMMALSVANNASMLGRSAASKKEDTATTNIVAGEIGRLLREHVVAIMDMVSRGRSDRELIGQWVASGASQFSSTNVGEGITQAEQVENITIKSPTFHKIYQATKAELILGEKATPEVMDTITDELEKNVTAEDMMPVSRRETMKLGSGDEEEKEDEEEEETSGKED